eukprot:CAMPEP_0195514218 /NCGR_PEP_ID=MMETSP0794_2-20130614/5673_1 /TAXON_ID=515487 /ORGANISM="Stephanopyxis turris, Strain CCMP 815" /LENGTH=47 /DNA_ID= /DNA_START= /DNA_END= /DNA_ORIENTATION=
MKSLLLNNNDLRMIPPALGMLEQLNNLDLRGNPQKSIRPGVLEKNCS